MSRKPLKRYLVRLTDTNYYLRFMASSLASCRWTDNRSEATLFSLIKVQNNTELTGHITMEEVKLNAWGRMDESEEVTNAKR